MADKILFLDDDHERHREFRSRALALGYGVKYHLVQVFTAKDAIKELEKGDVIQAFLDHDLSEDDILCEVGKPTLAPTGMVVVDHIVTMTNPPGSVVVHSLNYDAAVEMTTRLAAMRTILVSRIPFHVLLLQLKEA